MAADPTAAQDHRDELGLFAARHLRDCRTSNYYPVDMLTPPDDVRTTSPIVLGANHSGTRLVVQILKAVGNDAGSLDSAWHEEEGFLSRRKDLIYRVGERT